MKELVKLSFNEFTFEKGIYVEYRVIFNVAEIKLHFYEKSIFLIP